MIQYVELIKHILANGEKREDRTGTGTLSVFGGQLQFDLREKLPLVTIKKTNWRWAFTEMLWFIRGENNISYLHEHNIPIWDDWADAEGKLGPVYGVQWRSWQTTDGNKLDQLNSLISDLRNKPTSRRHIVTAWNPGELTRMGLPPCHRDFQCYVSNDGHLDLMWAQRSWDTALGAPFNIAQYALLTHLIARAAGLKARKLTVNYGDAHLYLNHVAAMQELVETLKPVEGSPQLVIKTDNIDIDGYKPVDFDVTGYESYPYVKLPIAV